VARRVVFSAFTELGAKRMIKLLTTRYGYTNPTPITYKNGKWWYKIEEPNR
jgi:hypothetical protein